RQVRRIHLLLQGAKPIPEHDDFVKEGLDRPGLLLQARRAWTQDEVAASPLVCRCDRRDAGLLADDASEQRFEICGRLVWQHDGWCAPLTIGHDGKWRRRLRRMTRRAVIGLRSRAGGLALLELPRRARRRRAWPAAESMFAATVAARHAQR